ncbi:MAG: hypothetical protein LUH14_06230 [Clostridiaceae bacterium]|nr:hypothetical protein [Clostridiaceae bacterium]
MENNVSESHYQRRLLFLYPDLDDYPNGEERDKIFRLVNYLNHICEEANSFMSKLFGSQIFVKSECVPTVVMKSISKNPENFENPDFKGVRVCITEYDGIKFDEYYKKYATMEARMEQDISHLIAINLFTEAYIKTKKKKPVKAAWKKSRIEGYDAEITLAVDELEHVLSSIMLDIALYHYFELPREFESRYGFGTIKKEYLEKEFSPKEMEGIYGSKAKSREEILYLPFAQSYIQKLYESVSCTGELISSFKDMIYKYVADWVVINSEQKTVSLRLRNRLYPDEHNRLAKELFDALEPKEKRDIADYYLQLRKVNTDAPIILLLCRNNVIADGQRKQKFLIETNMEPDRYINLEDDYVLFDIIEENLDEEL